MVERVGVEGQPSRTACKSPFDGPVEQPRAYAPADIGKRESEECQVVAGRFDTADLERRDADGVTLADALHAFGGDPAWWRLGLALLERRGVAACARAWRGTAPVRDAQLSATAVVELPAPSGELVGALASMALASVAGG